MIVRIERNIQYSEKKMLKLYSQLSNIGAQKNQETVQ